MGVGGEVFAEVGHPSFYADVDDVGGNYVLVPCDGLGIGKVKEGGREGGDFNGVIDSGAVGGGGRWGNCARRRMRGRVLGGCARRHGGGCTRRRMGNCARRRMRGRVLCDCARRCRGGGAVGGCARRRMRGRVLCIRRCMRGRVLCDCARRRGGGGAVGGRRSAVLCRTLLHEITLVLCVGVHVCIHGYEWIYVAEEVYALLLETSDGVAESGVVLFIGAPVPHDLFAECSSAGAAPILCPEGADF